LRPGGQKANHQCGEYESHPAMILARPIQTLVLE
jgi:hypothetical protein